jgi:NitT/TauT family transport system permease protein/taurine transport system permease protein
VKQRMAMSALFMKANGSALLYRSVVPVLTVLSLCLIWWAGSASGVISPLIFPPPSEVAHSFWRIAVDSYADGQLYVHVLYSLKRVLIGFAVATLIGIPLGLAMGFSPSVEAFVNPTFLLLRPIPPLAWIPLAIVWLGLDDAAKVLVIFIAAFIPAVINAYAGARSLPPQLAEAAAVLGIRNARFISEVLVPGALPMCFTGMRLSLQASWTTLVAAELIGATFGLGHVLNQAALDIDMAMIVVAMVCVAVLGALTNWALAVWETRLMPWRQV